MVIHLNFKFTLSSFEAVQREINQDRRSALTDPHTLFNRIRIESRKEPESIRTVDHLAQHDQNQSDREVSQNDQNDRRRGSLVVDNNHKFLNQEEFITWVSNLAWSNSI